MNTSNKSEVADLVIVGAGPAGSAVAIKCASKLSHVVVLHNHAERKGTESLSLNACKKLEQHSIRIGVPFANVVAWWGSDRQVKSPCNGSRIAHREELGRQMRARIPKSATVIPCNSRISVSRNGATWTVAFVKIDGTENEVKSKCICDATGRASVVGRALRARRRNFDNLCCVVVPVTGCEAGTWTEAVWNGWWNLCSDGFRGTLSFYSLPRLLGMAIRDLEGMLNESTELKRLVQFKQKLKPRVIACGSSILTPCAGPGWFAVGDAAAALQPLASAGIAKALRDAAFALQTVESDGQEYDLRYQAEFDDYLSRLSRHYRLETRWRDSDFWACYGRRSLIATSS